MHSISSPSVHFQGDWRASKARQVADKVRPGWLLDTIAYLGILTRVKVLRSPIPGVTLQRHTNHCLHPSKYTVCKFLSAALSSEPPPLQYRLRDPASTGHPHVISGRSIGCPAKLPLVLARGGDQSHALKCIVMIIASAVTLLHGGRQEEIYQHLQRAGSSNERTFSRNQFKARPGPR
jgi:hypothetical protein